jgi:hypothetical protein
MNIHGFNNAEQNRKARPADNNASGGFFGGSDNF